MGERNVQMKIVKISEYMYVLVIVTRLDVSCVSLYVAAVSKQASKQAIRTWDLQFIAHESVDNKIKRDVKITEKRKTN